MPKKAYLRPRQELSAYDFASFFCRAAPYKWSLEVGPGAPHSPLAAALMPKTIVIENVNTLVIHTLGYRFDLNLL
jgi:hypothetical protein